MHKLHDVVIAYLPRGEIGCLAQPWVTPLSIPKKQKGPSTANITVTAKWGVRDLLTSLSGG